MKKVQEKLSQWLQIRDNEEGLTTVEYAIVLALIAIVAMSAWQFLGTTVSKGAKAAAEKIQENIGN